MFIINDVSSSTHIELPDLNYFVEAQTLGNGKDFTTPDPADQGVFYIYIYMLFCAKSNIVTSLNFIQALTYPFWKSLIFIRSSILCSWSVFKIGTQT